MRKGSTIKYKNIRDIASTAVNISVFLEKICDLEIKLEITDINMKIDTKKPKDVLRICTRLLIDKEFRHISETKPKMKPYQIRGSKLDKHADEIIKKINNKAKLTDLAKQYNISATSMDNWIISRTKVDNAGITFLKVRL